MHNLIILSDVHLGSDLVHHARPDAPERARASARRDAELIALLDWYRGKRQRGKPWRLVIAGDFIDFVGMSLSPTQEGLRTHPTPEEVALGLGSAVDHTIIKLRRVAQHHRDVFRALAEFIADGNTLVVVRGNHDVDFHWPAVQDEFLRQLSLYSPGVRGRVEFAPWFYYEQNTVYVEHGHQYDAYCSHENVLHPVLPTDPRRSWRSMSDIMLSYVVRPTRGMTEAGHEGANLFDYLRFAFGLGLGGAVGLARRFAHAVAVLVGLWRDHFSEGARRIRAMHERRMDELARVKALSVEKLRALASLQCAPVTRSLGRILSGVLLDKILLVACGALCALSVMLIMDRWDHAIIASLIAIVGIVALGRLLIGGRVSVNATDELRERAARVATVFPAAFVVMGHTHMPEVRPSARGASTYVNLGAWAEDDVPDGVVPALPATRTHLVLVTDDAGEGPMAELMVWDSQHGPQRFVSAFEPESCEITGGLGSPDLPSQSLETSARVKRVQS